MTALNPDMKGGPLDPPGDVAHPPDTSRSKLSGQRIMQTFDFEERKIHFEPVPMYWKKITGKKGFPQYSRGKLDKQYPRSGEYSFKLIPDGGSVAFQYHNRRIRIKPVSDFQINGYVHLEQAENCRAQLSCALTDRIGRIIPGSLLTSNLVDQNNQGEDGWAKMQVYIPGNYPEARYITLGVWVLQQEQWDQQEQAQIRIFQKNVRAVAWFDDITIYQMPRVILRTGRPGNVFDGDEVAELQVEVEGVGTLDYHVKLTVRTAEGKLIQNEAWVLAGVEGEKTVRTIKLGELPAGLYESTLDILSADTLVAQRQLRFAKLAVLSGKGNGSGRGFGVIMMDNYAGDWDAVINLVRMVNAKRLKLPVWRRRAEQAGAIFSQKHFDRNLINLQRHNIQVVATFSEVPDELALKMKVGRRSLLDVLSQDVQFWRPQVASILAQYARQVPYWQIGGDFSESQLWDPRIRTVVQTMRGEFDKLVSDTVLAVPLNSMFEVRREQIGTSYVAMVITSAIAPRQIPAYLKDARTRGLDNIWATIEPLQAKGYNQEQILIDFAKRIAYAKKGQAQAIFINHPWEQRQYNARLVTEPTELFLVFRTLADQLGETRYAGEFNIKPGIPALIFERNGQGCLFTWNVNYDPQSGREPPETHLRLGQTPVMVDLFGNRTVLPTKNGVTKLKLTQWPVLISNVDSRIAMLRASLELSPAIIDARISRQQLLLKFVNPFHTTISGHLRFLIDERQNKNWIVDPISLSFVLQPRQQFARHIIMKFPCNELGGKKNLEAFFDIDADRNYNLRTSIPFEIRLFGVDVSIFTRRINQTDLLIQQVVTNESDQEISLNSFVDLPDQDHLERAIPRLQPGATVTKSYLVREASKWLGSYIRIGLYDPKGTKRLNNLIKIN